MSSGDSSNNTKRLSDEARLWDDRELTPEGWQDAPDAIPRAGESVAISIRVPKLMLEILREFARREGIGYQVLMKQWLHERIVREREMMKRSESKAKTEEVPFEAGLELRAASLTTAEGKDLSEDATRDPVARLAELFTKKADSGA